MGKSRRPDGSAVGGGHGRPLNFPTEQADSSVGVLRCEVLVNEFERSLIEARSLPTVPAIAQRLLELLADESVGLEELAD